MHNNETHLSSAKLQSKRCIFTSFSIYAWLYSWLYRNRYRFLNVVQDALYPVNTAMCSINGVVQPVNVRRLHVRTDKLHSMAIFVVVVLIVVNVHLHINV